MTNGRTDGRKDRRMDGRTNNPEAICPSNFFEVGGIKKSDIFHISAQNINCGYWLELPGRGSNKYPQYMFLSKNKNNNVYPYKPQFYNIKVEFKGSKLYRHVFVMSIHLLQTVYDSFTYSQQ